MTSTPTARVAVLLLNYQNAPATLACVASLHQLTHQPVDIWLVDNASPDDSLAQIQATYPDLHYIVSPNNLGFSGGNNLGFQAILDTNAYDYVWLLNNDTIVAPDSLNHLLHTAQQHPTDMVGPVIAYPDGPFQRIGSYFKGLTGRVKHYKESEIAEGKPVESLSGCAMLIPVDVLKTVGLWDEAYFLYWEDVDYCMAAKAHGVGCVISAQARVFHEEGGTTGRNKPQVTYYYQRNRLRLLHKLHKGIAWQLIWGYTQWRLVRSRIKANRNSSDPDARLHHQAFEWAVADFQQGVFGPCPHPIHPAP